MTELLKKSVYRMMIVLLVATIGACGVLDTKGQTDSSTVKTDKPNASKADSSKESKFALTKWPFGGGKSKEGSDSKSSVKDKEADKKDGSKKNTSQLQDGQSGDLDTLVDEQEKVVISYRTVLIYMARAQSQMATALELKEEAELMEAEAKALEADASNNSSDRGTFKKYSARSKSTNAAIVKKLEQGDKIKQSQHQQFTKALGSFIATTAYLNQFYVEAQPFFDSTISFLRKGATNKGGIFGKIAILQPLITGARKKLGTGLFILRSAPPTGFDYIKTGKRFVKFLKSNNVKVPKNTDKALAKVAIPNWKLL